MDAAIFSALLTMSAVDMSYHHIVENANGGERKKEIAQQEINNDHDS